MRRGRQVLLLLTCLTLFNGTLFALAGKPLPPQQVVKLYFTSKPDVLVELFTFRNKSGDTNLDYLSMTIPEQIAEQLENVQEITVDSNDIALQPHNYNRVFVNRLVTNEEGDVVTNRVVNTNIDFIAGESENLTLADDEILYNYYGTNVILKGNSNFTRRVRVHDNLLSYPNGAYDAVISNRKADIFIYGEIERFGYSLKLTAYIFKRHSGKLLSLDVTIDQEDVDEMLPAFCYEVSMRLNGKEKTHNISVTAEPADAMFYLNGIYFGRTEAGIYLSSLPLGRHRFVMKHEDYRTIDKVIYFRKSEPATRLHFVMDSATGFADVTVNVDVSQPDIYVDGLLRGQTNTLTETYTYGSHSLKVIADGYKEYYATFEITSTNAKTIDVSMNVITPRAFNHGRAARFLLGATTGLGLTSLGLFITKEELFDYAATTYQDAYTLDPTIGDFEAMSYYTPYANMNIAYNISLGLTLGTGAAWLVFYILSINSHDFPVENLTFSPSLAPGYAGGVVSFRY